MPEPPGTLGFGLGLLHALREERPICSGFSGRAARGARCTQRAAPLQHPGATPTSVTGFALDTTCYNNFIVQQLNNNQKPGASPDLVRAHILAHPDRPPLTLTASPPCPSPTSFPPPSPSP